MAILARRIRPRRSDLSRRTFLRAGLLGIGAAGLYFAAAGAVRLGGLPGAARRFTGSYETGSFDPDAMPDTIWLEDPVPAIDPDGWQLTVVDDAGRYQLKLGDLLAFDARMQATLDCTSGWYAQQDWSGVPVSALLRSSGQARSLLIHSGHGLLDPLAGEGRQPAIAGDARGRGSPVRRARIPAAPGRTRPTRVLVGEMGRPYRTADDALVVAAAIPCDLTSRHNLAPVPAGTSWIADRPADGAGIFPFGTTLLP